MGFSSSTAARSVQNICDQVQFHTAGSDCICLDARGADHVFEYVCAPDVRTLIEDQHMLTVMCS